MPPKEKVSKTNVSDMAFEMTREYGFKEVTARKLAKELKCSTQPIFRAYENMEELRGDLFCMSTEFFEEYILSKVKKARSKPTYLTVALAYIELANKEKNLFELIASIDDFGTQTISDYLQKDEWKEMIDKLPDTANKSAETKKEIFMMLWMFIHGLASLTVSNRVSLNDKQIKSFIERAYEGFKNQT